MTDEGQTIYSARATAYGDGRNGHVTSDDDVLDLDLAIPKEMGGPGGDLTNPEQMFAAGYSACFHGALKRVGAMAKADMTGSTVTGTVSMIRHGDLSPRSPCICRSSRPRCRGSRPRTS